MMRATKLTVGVMLAISLASIEVNAAEPQGVINHYEKSQRAAEDQYLKALKNIDADVVIQGEPFIGEASRAESVRLEVMRSTAISLGAQGGLYFEADEIETMLEKHRELLDQAFDFRPMLIIDSGGRSILPPVITAADGEAVVSDDGQSLRVATKTYKIDVPARFVLAAPTWRDYLAISHRRPVSPDNFLLPKNKSERALWSKWVEQGWRAGVRQAKLSATNNLRVMLRDFTGIIRYQLLRLNGYIDEPKVDADYYSVTGGGTMMAIEDVILTIKSPASLNTESEEWRPIPKLPDFSYLGLKNLFKEVDQKTQWDAIPTARNTNLRQWVNQDAAAGE